MALPSKRSRDTTTTLRRCVVCMLDATFLDLNYNVMTLSFRWLLLAIQHTPRRVHIMKTNVKRNNIETEH